MIAIFLNLLRLVLCPNMWSILKLLLVHFKIMYILLLLGEMLWSHQWKLAGLMCHLRLFVLFWFSVLKIYLWCKWGVKIPCYDCITVNLSLYVNQDLLYIFRCSYVGLINVYKGHILWFDWSIYHYVVSFFISYYSLGFKVFVKYKYCYSSF